MCKRKQLTTSLGERLGGGKGGRGEETLWGPGWSEESRTIEAGDAGSEGVISGGKLILATLMKAATEMRRVGEDQRGASGATDEMPWRWQSRAGVLAEQWRMVWLKVFASLLQVQQNLEKAASNQKGWAVR